MEIIVAKLELNLLAEEDCTQLFIRITNLVLQLNLFLLLMLFSLVLLMSHEILYENQILYEYQLEGAYMAQAFTISQVAYQSFPCTIKHKKQAIWYF